MAHQYFEDNEDLSQRSQTFACTLLGQPLHFTTEPGVFSRQRVDYGTISLLKAAKTVLPLQKPRKILDLGCGYGPVGITLAKLLPTAQITLSDVSTRALRLARANAEQNQVLDHLTFCRSDGYQQLTAQPFDLILTNPPVRAGKAVVTKLLTGGKDRLKKDGRLLAVLQKKQGAPSALKKLKAVYPQVQIMRRDKGYYVLSAQCN